MNPAPRRVSRPRKRLLAGTAIFVDDDQPTFWDRMEAGRWEPGTLAVLTPLLGPDTTFLDLGAWVGPLSLLAAAHGARVVAVDADPAAQDQFRRNLQANPGLAEKIELVEAAISPLQGTVRLGGRRKPGDSMSSVLLAGAGTTWTAPTITPAALAAKVAGAGRLVVKIDIEGGEYALVPHLGPLLTGRDVSILVSFHPVILSQAGEPDPQARLREAVAVFEGWQVVEVTPEGSCDRGVLTATTFALADTDTWLFRKPLGRSVCTR